MENPAETFDQAQVKDKSASKKGIFLALGIAFALHAVFLLVPINRQVPDIIHTPARIELQLTTIEPPQLHAETFIPEALPVPELIRDMPQETSTAPPEQLVEAAPITPLPTGQTLIPINRDIEKMTIEEKGRLTNIILSSQFITEESAAERLFRKPLHLTATRQQKTFHYPIQQNFVAMLDKPMQDLPFDYTPGLVHFAYDPGVKGDLQRFWDVITPEFGWTTKYGTEVKCIWVLVIAGCGWK